MDTPERDEATEKRVQQFVNTFLATSQRPLPEGTLCRLRASFYALSLGTCLRCSLRYGRAGDPALLDSPDHIVQAAMARLHDLLPEEERADRPMKEPDSPCVVCYDVLRGGIEGKAQTSFEDQVDAQDFEWSPFSVGIQIPLSLVIRSTLLWARIGKDLGLKDMYSRECSYSLPDLKDIIRSRIEAILQRKSNMQTGVSGEASLLRIQVSIVHEETTHDYKLLIPEEEEANSVEQQQQQQQQQQQKKKKKRRKRRGIALGSPANSTTAVMRVLASLSAEDCCRLFAVLHRRMKVAFESPAHIEVTYERPSIWIAGRYNKFSRCISQSPWHIGGHRRGETSLAEVVSRVARPVFRPFDVRFQSAGREDIDVRMLGNGRPFVVEMVVPRRISVTHEEVKAMEDAINASTHALRFHDLRLADKSFTKEIKDGEEAKQKTYRSVVWLSRPITQSDLDTLRGIRELTIEQKTPIRVLHRRSLAVRRKILHELSCQVINPHFLLLDLTTQAGTYIKEFVHGDRGRTVPSLSSLLQCDVDICQLDVLDIRFR